MFASIVRLLPRRGRSTMSDQPHCGCPVPVMNPPDIGAAWLPAMPSGMPVDLPYPIPSRLLQRIFPRADYNDYAYDKADRLLSRTYSYDSSLCTFAYDAVGNRTVMVDVIGGVRYTSTYNYDDVNRMGTTSATTTTRSVREN